MSTITVTVVGPPLQNTRLRKVSVAVADSVPLPEQCFELLANPVDLSDVTQCHELVSVRVGFKEVRKCDNGGGAGRHLWVFDSYRLWRDVVVVVIRDIVVVVVIRDNGLRILIMN